MEHMSDGEKIICLLSELGITQKELADRLGLKPNTISTIKQGRKRLTERNMKVIAKEFNVSLEWLKTGTGDIRAEGNSDIDIMQHILTVLKNNDKKKKDLILKICKMDRKNTEMCSRIIDSFF